MYSRGKKEEKWKRALDMQIALYCRDSKEQYEPIVWLVVTDVL